MHTMTLSVLGHSSMHWRSGSSLVPGLFLSITIATAAFVLRSLSGITALSPLIIAIVLGLAYRNAIGAPAAFKLPSNPVSPLVCGAAGSPAICARRWRPWRSPWRRGWSGLRKPIVHSGPRASSCPLGASWVLVMCL